MKPLLILSLLFTLLSQNSHAFSLQEIGRYPRAGNLLRLLHSPMRRYKNRLVEELFFYDNGLGCLESDFGYSICARSEWIVAGKKRKDSVRLINANGNLIQEFFHVQEGDISSLALQEDLLNFNFRLVGHTGFYEAKGLTSIRYNWYKGGSEERSVLVFDPANFYLEIIFTQDLDYARLRYDVRCDFCGGLDWIEIQEHAREGLPNSVLYYSSSEPRDVTPRLFDSLLEASYFRPMRQLGGAIQKTLVEEGGFFPVQF